MLEQASFLTTLEDFGYAFKNSLAKINLGSSQYCKYYSQGIVVFLVCLLFVCISYSLSLQLTLLLLRFDSQAIYGMIHMASYYPYLFTRGSESQPFLIRKIDTRVHCSSVIHRQSPIFSLVTKNIFQLTSCKYSNLASMYTKRDQFVIIPLTLTFYGNLVTTKTNFSPAKQF